MGAFNYINRAYGLTMKRGTRVRYTGGEEPRLGTVTHADGAYLRIRMDDCRFSQPYHPTWELEILP